MRYFLDTEFIDDGKTIELISIGICAEDGREYYAESSEYDKTKLTPWLKENVIPHLTEAPISKENMGLEILTFCNVGEPVEFWGYFAAYDYVALCQIWGRMLDIPKPMPHRINDLKQLMNQCRLLLNQPKDQRHNALVDARWMKKVFDDCHALFPLFAT